MGFSSVPRLPGWSFQQLIYGGVLPPPHCPDKSGPAVSPTDKLRKDSALTPVTSEKSTLFLGLQRLSGCAKISESTQISYNVACQKADKKTRLNYCGKKDRRYHSNSLTVIKAQKQ